MPISGMVKQRCKSDADGRHVQISLIVLNVCCCTDLSGPTSAVAPSTASPEDRIASLARYCSASVWSLHTSRLPAISSRAANTVVDAEDAESLDARKREQRQPTVTPATHAAIDCTTTGCLCLISAAAIHRHVPRRRADLRPNGRISHCISSQ